MKHIKFPLKRMGTLFLVFFLSFSFLVPEAPISAIESNIFEKNKDTLIDGPYNDNDKVSIIVELKTDPLLSQPKLKAYSSTEEYLQSNSAQKEQLSIAEAEKKVERQINQKDIDIKIKKKYSAVISGFSAEISYGDIEEIRKIKGVKNVFVGEKYKLIEPKLSDSVSTIGGSTVQETGYTGKGTAVAILDTGLDMNHEAFKGSVNNPRYEKSDIAESIKNNRLTIGKLSADVVYHSSKIPYAFDYAGNDYNVSGGPSHGTHVAGITGANSGDKIKGVAPDAQFFIMKVFRDSQGGASDEDILAALDDSIKLGCDVINMSLGTASGFSEDSNQSMRKVYRRIEDSGINLYCAAGNDYSSSYRGASGNDLPLVSNPDNATIASPSTYDAALAVASVNNKKSTSSYFKSGEEKIRFLDSAAEKEAKFNTLKGTFEYVDCETGASKSFTGKNVQNKIALIQRGGLENGEVLTFAKKESHAVSAGAKAVVIYDNVEGDLVSMATDHKIPVVFISKADGEKLLKAENKNIDVNPEYIGKFKDSFSGQMSDFSSWGVTPDLKLKPEITAPGGNIYSAVTKNNYESMSGTSMASPHLAGAGAIMRQYIRTQLNLDLNEKGKSQLVNALMLSTASPVKDKNKNTVSPRKQGAGMVQLQNATNTGAYLTDKNGNRPLISLGANSQGSFEFSFLLNRLKKDATAEYEVTVTPQTEAVKRENGRNYIAQETYPLSEDKISVKAPKKITLGTSPSNIDISLSLTDSGKEFLSENFPNGIFIEGFVTLTPVTGSEKTALSLPFMGFYGDWSMSPIFDSTVYDNEDAGVVEMYLGQFQNHNGAGHTLGHNLYGNAKIYDVNKIAINGGDKNKHVTAVCALLRNADKLEFSVKNKENKKIYSETLNRVARSSYSSHGFYRPMARRGWRPENDWNESLPEGKYTYTVTASLGENEKFLSFPITIDNKKPEVINSQIKDGKWKVTVKDNHYVQAVGITTGGTPLTGWINPDEKEEGKETTVIFDLKDKAFKGLSKAKVAVVDYADNKFLSSDYNIESSGNGSQEYNLKEMSKYYQCKVSDPEWSSGQIFDLNHDNVIDIEDLALALKRNKI